MYTEMMASSSTTGMNIKSIIGMWIGVKSGKAVFFKDMN